MQSAVRTATMAPGTSAIRASPSPRRPWRSPAYRQMLEWTWLRLARLGCWFQAVELVDPKPCSSQGNSDSGSAR